MKKNDYEIRVVQQDPKQIIKALEGLEESEDNTLCNNCVSFLRVGNNIINVPFKNVFYSDDIKRLTLFMEDSSLPMEEFKKMLDRRKIEYNEVTFLEQQTYYQPEDTSLSFVSTREQLEESLKDSKEKGIDSCDYYPSLFGRIELRYSLEDGTLIPFDRQTIRGAIKTSDKMILLMTAAPDKKVKYREILKMMEEHDITPTIIFGKDEIIRETNVKQYKKEQ